MKKIALTIISSCMLGAVAYADGEATEIVVSLSSSEIRQDANQLAGWQQVSSGQPDQAVLEVVSGAGFKTVVDLRGDGEDRGFDEAASVEAQGMEYVSLPIYAGSGVDITYENAARLDAILAQAEGPVLVHCASGNRVGALYALRAKLAGASDEEAMSVGNAAGLTRLRPLVEQLLREK